MREEWPGLREGVGSRWAAFGADADAGEEPAEKGDEELSAEEDAVEGEERAEGDEGEIPLG